MTGSEQSSRQWPRGLSEGKYVSSLPVPNHNRSGQVKSNTHSPWKHTYTFLTQQPYLAYLQPDLVQRQEQNSLLQLLQGDLFVVPAGSDLGLKDAG